MDTPIVLLTIQTGFQMLQDLPNQVNVVVYEGGVEQVNQTCEQHKALQETEML